MTLIVAQKTRAPVRQDRGKDCILGTDGNEDSSEIQTPQPQSKRTQLEVTHRMLVLQVCRQNARAIGAQARPMYSKDSEGDRLGSVGEDRSL